MAPDLFGRHLRQLAAHHDGREEPRILAQPAVDAPVVCRARELGREVWVVMAGEVAVIAKGQDGAPDVRGREQLVPHGRVIRAGLPASRRIGVGAHEAVWVRESVLHREGHVARRPPVGDVLSPALRQIWDQLGIRAPSVVDVTVDDRARVHDRCSFWWRGWCAGRARCPPRPPFGVT